MKANIREEALRIVGAAEAQGIILRLLGGLAVSLRSPGAARRGLERTYPDIDVATPARQGRVVETLMTRLGYEPDKSFNLLNGESRLLFYDREHKRQIDVFVGDFAMCHRLPLAERLTADTVTLPLAELLLSKLQIVRMNEKDLRDICALLLDHQFGATDAETINVSRIVGICANDWGWWKTVQLSLDKVLAYTQELAVSTEDAAFLREQALRLRQALEAAPKSTRWKMRAVVGERVRWYEEAEEVDRG